MREHRCMREVQRDTERTRNILGPEIFSEPTTVIITTSRKFARPPQHLLGPVGLVLALAF